MTEHHEQIGYEEAEDRVQDARRTSATKLDLSQLGLTELPESIGQLSQLQRLDLSKNQLTALPASIAQLSQLRELSLDHNRLIEFSESIAEIPRLWRLDLTSNSLKLLPQSVGNLANLTWLSLAANRLGSLPEIVLKMRRLRELHLAHNGLQSLPPEIARLTRLEVLTLGCVMVRKSSYTQWGRAGANLLTTIPESIGRLTKLRMLDLGDNELVSLPETLTQLSSLEGLFLGGNPELGIPQEILGASFQLVLFEHIRPAKPSDILQYYFRAKHEPTRRLNEAKVLLVGQGGVGKTSLVKRLLHDAYDPDEKKTEGINIETWEVPGKCDAGHEGETVRLNIWDFGGQEIMHATHQFFLTKRSLYLLILDARKGENESNIHYWLKIIQSYGGDSPVLVVTNKTEAHHLELNETRLRKDYAPNVQGFFKVSCETGAGIGELRAAIKDHIRRLPHVFDVLPNSYFEVKRRLEEKAKTRNFIDIGEYRRLCQKHGVNEKIDQDQLIRFLHDLGNVLNFDDPDSPYELKDTNILNPEWVTGGVYRIINNKAMAEARGELEMSQLGGILDDHQSYPIEKHTFIVGMMRKFELCFEFPDARERILIPELLPKNEPELDVRQGESLDFEYHYSVLPGGIICRFIVRMPHRLAKPPVYWLSGVMLNIDGNPALVRSDTQAGRMYISVFGPVDGRRRALTVIRDNFLAIHATIPKLDAVEKVPLPNDPGITVNYTHLLKLEKRGVDSFLPDGAENDYSVLELLEGIEEEKDRKKRARQRGEGVSAEHVPARKRAPTPAELPGLTDQEPFDVFLSHNSKDKPTVRRLGERLKERGLKVWLDEWELTPGRPWQEALEVIIETSGSAAVLVGKDGLGPWEVPEMRGCLNEFVKRRMPVIPVLLPGAGEAPKLPLFLTAFTWVDLRSGLTEDGLDKLEWGIRGKKPMGS